MMSRFLLLISCYLILFAKIDHVNSNGRLLEPACRSSLWRFPEYKQYDPPTNYNDNHLDCGGALVDEDEKQCGICGDPIADTVPRPNEDGGIFSKCIIARHYNAGQEIPVTVQLTYGQKGFFDFKLCAEDDPKSHVDPHCYDKNILKISGVGEKYLVTESAGKYYNLTLELPKDIKCSNCVLRWRYRTGANWGECKAGKPGALGCGPQTSFYGCSDISIA